MNIPFRTRRLLRRVILITLICLAAVALIALLWFIWLDRYVVYTRQDGAVIDKTLSETMSPGLPGTPPQSDKDVNIYYNEGENAINTSRELTRITGYYADTAALEKGVDTVLAQIKALPSDTAVMLDVKNAKGAFFYSSAMGTNRYPGIDPAAMDGLISYLKSTDIYTIARLPALRDYYYGLNHVPDGLPTSGGYLWADDDYCYWLNPASQGTISYLIQIVAELKSLGFDEVVFDSFQFPDTDKIVFNGDKDSAIAASAKTLLSACATNSFAVSFVGQTPAFPLPEGRSRLYLAGASAADAASLAAQTGLAEPAIHLVFTTEIHDTRFEEYSVLRPLAAAH